MVTRCSSTINANLLLVANDKVLTNKFRQELMGIAVFSYAKTRYFSLQKTIEVIHKIVWLKAFYYV
ncbi:PTS sugar transporter subunit IIB [Candidatus Izimaplasma bacterium ZiA1]|uniref:PTS sugar transporter subunit IIB n=1 Tax=Candidatus Izimoplasma sp. ZiA1 TaxID=2024899 RepID=UPI00143BA991